MSALLERLHNCTYLASRLEYTAPESLSITQQPSSKADMWSLGMILHMLVFFRLPYHHVDDGDIVKLEEEVRTYSGYLDISFF